MNFKKKDIVWYYLLPKQEWRRGKIVAVNKYHLKVKDSTHHNLVRVDIGERVVDGALAKPTGIPMGHKHPLWDVLYSYYPHQHERLFRKLGFIK